MKLALVAALTAFTGFALACLDIHQSQNSTIVAAWTSFVNNLLSGGSNAYAFNMTAIVAGVHAAGPGQGDWHSNHTDLTARWMNVIAPENGRGPWPYDGKTMIATITYCFVDSDTELEQAMPVTHGWELWKTALGGPASKANGHRLNMQPYQVSKDSKNKFNYCFHPKAKDSDPDIMNEDLTGNELFIYQQPVETGGTHATPGYQTTDVGQPRNKLFLVKGLQGGVPDYQVAHELGHVFGLSHEHQRSDASQYVGRWFNNLKNYDKAVQLADEEGDDIGYIDSDYWTAQWYDQELMSTRHNVPDGYKAHQFIKDPSVQLSDSTYDFDSLMHYSSFHFADPAKCPYYGPDAAHWPNWKNCVLHKVDPEDPNNGFMIGFNTKISAGDVAGVKQMYPWIDK